MKFIRINYFTGSELYRVVRYSADTEYRMVNRYIPIDLGLKPIARISRIDDELTLPYAAKSSAWFPADC